MSKKTLGTIWLDACSGCHMSFLDLDEGLIEIARQVDVVYSPLVDHKEIPGHVDVFLISGAVSTDEDHRKVRDIRQSSDIVISLGDCAVTGNVASMRNVFSTEEVITEAYVDETVDSWAPLVPRLTEPVKPVHHVVEVDGFIPGCPPGRELIAFYLREVLEGRLPGRAIRTKFG
jgi:NAD-reducing hydrogenase small subunit